jgi:uncharacterized protein YfaP (DUF2135 family)
MSWIRRQLEVKLDLLESLARSQRALSRMIESLADVTVQSADTAANLKDNIHAIAEYQKVMAEKVMGISMPDAIRRSGRLTRPWTNEQAGVKAASGCMHPPAHTDSY